jgi:hypothetical protein
MEVQAFAELAAEFSARVQQMVWCSAATVDAQGRPRSRILHPVWEGHIGWITTRRHSVKERHLARMPYLSLAYVADAAKPVYVDCHVEWIDVLEEKRRVWALIAALPAPEGFDPAPIYGSPEDAGFGLLRLLPWRIEVATPPSTTYVWHTGA